MASLVATPSFRVCHTGPAHGPAPTNWCYPARFHSDRRHQGLRAQFRDRLEDAPPLFILIHDHAGLQALLHRAQGGAGCEKEPFEGNRNLAALLFERYEALVG